MRRLALALSLAGVGAGLIVVAVSLGWGGSVAAQPRGQFRAFLPGLAADSARGAPFTPVATTTSQAVLVTPTPPIIVISPGFVAPAATSTATPTPQPVTLVTPTPTSTATATPTPVPVPGNTPPSFVKGADVTVLEDAGPQTVNGWATAISSGTPPEAAQPVQFIVTGNTNAALFAAGPAVSPTGTLTFTPAANANGTATVTVVLRDNGGTSGGGNDTSPAQSFVINVTAVNDAPSFTAGPNQSVDQDSGAHAVNPWATTVSAGAANEGAQTLTFAVTSNSTPGLFSAGPAISPSGALTYTPAAGQTGTATISVTLSDNGGTANGGVDTSAAQSFTITVLVVNTPPTAVDDPATVLEDAGATAIPVLANDTDPDGGPMLVQSVTQPANGAVAITGGGTGLTYAPALNYCNTPPGTTLDTFTYTLNGGSTATVSMTVTCVNDAPSFTAVNPPTVVEDAGAQSIASWITGFSPGPANESTQTALAYPVSNVSNPALFSAGPAVAADGTLTYTPAANASGSSTFQVRVQDSGGTADGGVDLSPLQTFTVTVTGLAPDLALTKSDGAVTVAPGGTVTYALGYSNGGTAAAAGVVITETVPAGSSFNAGASTAGWACVPNANAGSSCTFAVGAVAIGGSGSVNFAVNVTGAVAQLSNTAAIADDGADGADLDPANNSATDTTPVVLPSADLSITKTNGVATLAPGAQTTYTITVVNSGPNGVSGVSVADTFPAALTGVTWTCVGAGGGTCTAAGTGSIADSVNLPNGASVTYTATGTVSAGATGTLANTATVSYPADPAPGNNSATDTDSLGAQADLAITKTDGVTTVAVGGTTTYTIVASNAGPSNVTAATVADTFPAAISGATWTCVGAGGGTCTGAGSGNLSDTVNLPSGGSVTYTVVATISGAASPGTLVNTATVSSAATDPAPANNSATDTDTLVVVNNAPSFTSGGNVTVLEDSAAFSAAWATNISDNDTAVQILTFNVTGNTNAALFSALPAVDPATGFLSFTPAADAFGTADITVTLSDNGGTANGGADTSAPVTFTITVTGVNDAPSFTAGANQTAAEDAGAQTVASWATAISRGPANEAGQTLTFVVTNDNGALFSAAPAVSATGALTYTPAANANGVAIVTVHLQDNGGTANGGVDQSTPAQTFTITVTAVNDPPLVTAPGPFAVTGNVLISVPAPGLLTTVSDPADGAGAAPFTVSSASITSAQSPNANVTVNTSTGAFTYNPPPGFEGTDTFTYQVCDSGVPLPAACTSATVTLNISGMIWFVDVNALVAGDGRLSNPFATLAAFAALNNDGAGNKPAANDNIFLFEAPIGTDYTGPVTLLAGQKLIGQDATATLASLAGVTLAPNSATLPVTDSGNGLIVRVVGGTSVTVSAGSNTVRGLTLGNATASLVSPVGFGTLTVLDVIIANSNGQALNLNGGTLDATFTNISSTGGPSNIALTNIATVGTVNLGTGTLSGSTAGAGNHAFFVSGGTGSFTYTGTIAKVNQGNVVNISGKTGGSVTLSGAIIGNFSTGIVVANNTTNGTITFSGTSKQLNTGVNPAVTLTNNDLATITFSGGPLVIDTTSGAGFSATLGAAAINVTGTGNTISSTTGTALNVNASTIGASGLTFQSISVNGGTNGILLNTTGSFGGLTVTGTGTTAGSGGTIQNTTSRGASFISATNISLANMVFTNAGTTDLDANNAGLSTGDNLATNAAIHLQTVTTTTLTNLQISGGAEQGINGNTVSNFTLSNSSITNAGNEPDEDGIHFFNMSGTSAITNTTITSTVPTPNTTGGDDHLNLQMQSGTLNLTISGGSATNANKGSGYLFGIRGTTDATITFSSANASNNFSGGIVADAFDNAKMRLSVTNSTSSGSNDQLSVSAGDNSQVSLDASGNTLTSASTSDFVVLFLLGSAFDNGFVFNARITNNTITTGNQITADAIFVFNAGGGQMNVAITNNTVNYQGTQRPITVNAGQDGAGAINATITGNTIDIRTDGTNDAFGGIIAQAAISSPTGDGASVCADIGGAGALRNTFTRSLGGAAFAAGDIRVRQRLNGTMRLPGYAGAATDTAAVQAYLNGRNTVLSPSTATVNVTGFAGGGACTQPTIPIP